MTFLIVLHFYFGIFYTIIHFKKHDSLQLKLFPFSLMGDFEGLEGTWAYLSIPGGKIKQIPGTFVDS